MSGFALHYDRGGIFLPELDLWLDSPRARKGPERAFVSHAHSDHTAAHREVILTAATARLMQVRLGGRREEHRLEYGARHEFGPKHSPWSLTLLPAGHILGSAMALIEHRGRSLLYTGDFKLRPGLTAEHCQPHPAEVLIMETTFGRPEYRFPAASEVWTAVLGFCRETLATGATPVLLGYSLGKSQEILRALAESGLPVRVPESVARMTRVYEESGQTFPACRRWESAGNPGEIIVSPPQGKLPETLAIPGGVRTAVLTGWAIDSSCRYRYGCDAAFPISDHADFDELIEFVRLVRPKRVYTVHGFAADFAWTLRDLGYDAQALSEPEQLTLALGASVRTS